MLSRSQQQQQQQQLLREGSHTRGAHQFQRYISAIAVVAVAVVVVKCYRNSRMGYSKKEQNRTIMVNVVVVVVIPVVVKRATWITHLL